MSLHVVEHPVARSALAALRDRTTRPTEFRRLARRVAVVLALEATRRLPTSPLQVETPLEAVEGLVLTDQVVVVPILRAGLGLLDGVLELLPRARVGHLGLRRDERTAVASTYLERLPDRIAGTTAFILDPMLATGGTAIAAASRLREAGVDEIALLSVVAAPEGVAAVEDAHPEAQIYTVALDRELNARKFILPGLGDFGDRLYGTVI